MTLPLMGRTVYLESLYYPGWWVGASDRHSGALFQLSEVMMMMMIMLMMMMMIQASVFDPAQPCRVEVVDCCHTSCHTSCHTRGSETHYSLYDSLYDS